LPDAKGRALVRSIFESISRSNHILRMVLPLMDATRLINNPAIVGKLKIGQRTVMYPAKPVATNKPVCRLLIRGQYKCILVTIIFISKLRKLEGGVRISIPTPLCQAIYCRERIE